MPYPTQLFTEEKEAIEWLKRFGEQYRDFAGVFYD